MTTLTAGPQAPVSLPPVDAPARAARTATAPRPSLAPFVAAALGALAAVGATEWIVSALQLHMHV
jgi:hypothetical protein